MKKLAVLSTIALFALVAGCNNSSRVEGQGATTDVQACEKGEACCKVTQNKADCKSECTGGSAAAAGACKEACTKAN